jgi:pimeloyl-ACP methyl ester carboxylesterase
MNVPTMDGITAKTITTPRLSTRVLFSADEAGIPVVFVHGNVSSATYWEELMLALPAGYRGVAADNRGYGGAAPKVKIDATRGMGDFSDDLAALLDTLEIEQAHMVGHSLGCSILWRFMIDHPNRILTVTMAAPGSPYGFGGTKDAEGTPCFPDFAGSGGGITNPEFVRLVKEGYRGTDHQVAPRNIMNNFYWKPSFKPAREEELLSSMMSIHVGDKEWAGDSVPSPNYPFVAPGKFGPNNAISPAYAGDVTPLYNIEPKPPVLWVRGADDQIVGDASFFDMGTLGALGFIPGYPGQDVFPSQPMVGQTRAVLEKYQAAGGQYQEIVLENCGHSPYIEKLAEFNAAFHPHLGKK